MQRGRRDRRPRGRVADGVVGLDGDGVGGAAPESQVRIARPDRRPGQDAGEVDVVAGDSDVVPRGVPRESDARRCRRRCDAQVRWRGRRLSVCRRRCLRVAHCDSRRDPADLGTTAVTRLRHEDVRAVAKASGIELAVWITVVLMERPVLRPLVHAIDQEVDRSWVPARDRHSPSDLTRDRRTVSR